MSTRASTPTTSARGKPRGGGAKRGRKPKNPVTPAPEPTEQAQASTSASVHWAPGVSGGEGNGSTRSSPAPPNVISTSGPSLALPTPAGAPLMPYPAMPPPQMPPRDEDVEGEDELLPAMADDDYTAQECWQSQSKDNLKVLMENLSTEQYDRFEAYRRHALSKQAVRKVIQQSLGQQVSQPVAQIVAGFAKVFVGEMVEKARAVQDRRGEQGPLSPDHLREAYRVYQDETGRVGAARPLRSKKLFVR